MTTSPQQQLNYIPDYTLWCFGCSVFIVDHVPSATWEVTVVWLCNETVEGHCGLLRAILTLKYLTVPGQNSDINVMRVTRVQQIDLFELFEWVAWIVSGDPSDVVLISTANIQQLPHHVTLYNMWTRAAGVS